MTVQRRPHASGTTVEPEKTKAEIERLLVGIGANELHSGWDEIGGYVRFGFRNRLYRVAFPYPDPAEKRFARDGNGRTRAAKDAQLHWRAEVRRAGHGCGC